MRRKTLARTALIFVLAIIVGIAVWVFKPLSTHSPILILIQQNGKIGFIDATGNLVIPSIYLNGSDFSEGVAAVRQGGVYGYIDLTGKCVIAPQFDWAEPFSDSLAIVNKGGKYYYINHDGQSAFPCHYQRIAPFHYGVAIVQTYDYHMGLLDKKGKLIVDTLYDIITGFDEGLAVVKQRVSNDSTLEGIVDTLGHFIIPTGKYATVSNPNNGYLRVTNVAGDQIIIDQTGKVLFTLPETDQSYIDINELSEDILPIRLYKNLAHSLSGASSSSRNAYAGYINLHNGLLLDDTINKEAQPFSCGRAFIQPFGGGYRLIDNHMQRVGDDEYQAIKDPGFVHGYAIVSFDQGDAVIDTNGRIVFRPSGLGDHQLNWLDDYSFIDRYVHGDSTNLGIVASSGKVISPPNLEDIDRTGFVHGRLKVIKAGRLAVMDTKGNMIWEDSSPRSPLLRALNVDYMLSGYFYANSSPNRDRKPDQNGGWAVSKNIPKKIRNHSFGIDTLQLFIDTTSVDTFSLAYRGFPVYLANTTGDTCHFNAEDSRLYLKTQARTSGGDWNDIDYLLDSWCGNSYHKIALEPGAYWQFTMPQFEGAVPVNLRLQLQFIDEKHGKAPKALYSNIIRSAINPAQLWNKRPYYPKNLMDPYINFK